MKLSIGIVGLPNVGKSTLFNLLTRQQVNVANYPFVTINPNVGIVEVPDERLEQVARIAGAERAIPPIVEFYDIAGLVKGAHKGEGLGNQFLAHIREVKTIVHVVRCFPSPEVVHIDGSVNPLRDMEVVHTELILKDLETVEKYIAALEKETRSGDKHKVKDLEIAEKVRGILDSGQMALTLPGDILDESLMKELSLLTAKPQIYLLNGEAEDVPPEILERIRSLGGVYLIMNLAEVGDLSALVKAAYATLDLITFFTIESKDARGWTVKRGTRAPQAGGVIHTDFENKFIRAEVINWNKLAEVGDWHAARAQGLIRTEGKDYAVQDGDVLLIRHS